MLKPLAAGIGLACTIAAGAAAAQSPSLDAVMRELRQMRAEQDTQIERMRAAYESRLGALEERLRAAEGASTTARDDATKAAETARRAEVSAKAAQATAASPAPTGGGQTQASASAFNPAMGVVLNGTFAKSKRDPSTYRVPGFALGGEASPTRRGFALGESEISLSANIDQALFGQLTVSITPENTIAVEEGFIQTTSLPYGAAVKAGRFFSGIGYLNSVHAHAWDFADAALPYRVFFNNQYGDDGVQARWLAPLPFFAEIGVEGYRGDSFPAGGAQNNGAGTYAGFAHFGDDIGESHSFRFGLSHLRARAANRSLNDEAFTGRSGTSIADFVYKWAPYGNGEDTNFKFNTEYFRRSETGLYGPADSLAGYNGVQTGWYAQGVYQFMPKWRVGLRHDRVKAGDPGTGFAGTRLDTLSASPRRNTAMVDYSTSEFGRLRLQYNRDNSRPDGMDQQLILQYTVSIGAHGAHAY
ncbi:MAG: hypothetical protein HY059_20395 [Proteobacteria bacterium]|nr:hypothetical protein [Pseudomonadota bacterium]